MLKRCADLTDSAYGGRGIAVDPVWLDFERFYVDMGPRPTSKHSIERKDNNGPYSPDNCKWATREEQLRNTRRTRRCVLNGESRLVLDVAAEYALSSEVLWRRLQRGESAEDAVTRKPRRNVFAYDIVPGCLSVATVARRLGVDATTVLRWIHKQRFPGAICLSDPAKHWVIPESGLSKLKRPKRGRPRKAA